MKSSNSIFKIYEQSENNTQNTEKQLINTIMSIILENKDNNWLSSKEAIKLYKLKSCDLMHYRLAGKLIFEKKGNAYYYSKESLKKINSNI